MNMRKLVKINTLGVLTWVCAMAVNSYAQKQSDYVPLSLIKKAATYYGEERWPGCRMVSITPYFALDGSVNAYVAQFAKRGSTLATDTDIVREVAARQAVEKRIKSSCPVERKEVADGEADVSARTPPRNDVINTSDEMKIDSWLCVFVFHRPSTNHDNQSGRNDGAKAISRLAKTSLRSGQCFCIVGPNRNCNHSGPL